jgi:F5/8 type C domain
MTAPVQADSAPQSEWQPTASGNALLTLSTVTAAGHSGVQMEFDFKGGGGFVVARRALRRSMPEEYAVHFLLRGQGAANDVELKLVDPTGSNVWRHTIKGLQLTARWKRMSLRSQDFEFAWGPAGGGNITQLGFMEFAIVGVAGVGGQGRMAIADLDIEDCTPQHAPTATASSTLPDFEAPAALTGSGWRPRGDDPRPWIMIDFMQARIIGGLIIDWQGAAPASGFRIRGSNNALRWKTLHTALAAGGKHSYVYLPGAKSRYLRVELKKPSLGAALRVQSFEFSRSIDAFWRNVAGAEARGWHPRWLHQEQSLWTPIGTSHGSYCMLMNDDGMIEVNQGSFSIEPMIWMDGRLLTWTDVPSRQELLQGWIPVPSVIWETADIRLNIRAEATSSGMLRVCYRLENLSARPISAKLYVLLRPFQVTPPWQSFRTMGGVSRIHDLSWRDGAALVNHATRIVPMSEPAGFAALRFDDGFMAAHLASGALPKNTVAHDAFGFATGALGFEVPLQAHEARETILCCASVAAAPALDEPAFDWAAGLAVRQCSGNGWISDAIRAQLTATAHILVTRSGPALQPGPRRYTRSWIRDGTMMSAALLRMGHADEAREFIRWYAPYQRADGFVPCCVDREGVDWLIEHDSHGQLLALIADHYRFTADRPLLEELWPYVDKAVGCIERLLEPDGLMPISVSHEGYLAQPVHSYWDGFWTLRGLRDAEHLARVLGRNDTAQHWQSLSARVASGLFASIAATRARRQLDFIPGSAEWADFDPTATANAIALLDVPEGLDRTAVERTFDMYLADWRAKRSGAGNWTNYTPYEIRIIAALVRLRRREAALDLLRFFLSDRRPPPWNQWPEIAWRDRKAPAHLGDLPHTWIAAEYVLAIRSLFAYEREADQTLVLAAGLAPEWIEGSGVQVHDMPTLYGRLSYSLRSLDSETLRFEISGGLAARIVLRPPLAAPLLGVTVDGSPWTSFDEDSITLAHAPALVLLTLRGHIPAPAIT